MSDTKLQIGIVGLPNVGKSTLFNALTKRSVDAANYPFCTIDPSVGTVSVPDERLDCLADISNSVKVIPAVVEFVDIAGLVSGAHRGEGLGNKFLSHIREVDAIAEVVRVFENPDIAHVHGDTDPLRDIEIINLELIMADRETVKKRLDSLEKDVKRDPAGAKRAVAGFVSKVVELELCARILEALERGEPARDVFAEEYESAALKGLHLLSAKPVLYVLNKYTDGKNITDTEEDERHIRLLDFLDKSGAEYVDVDADVEATLKELEIEEKQNYRREMGTYGDGIDGLIKAGYKLLNLITFFTTGPKETRAWTVSAGTLAPEAGAVIHSDFCNKFIRADVIGWRELSESGGYAVAREKGLVRTEGKNYIVQDGDVFIFKI